LGTFLKENWLVLLFAGGLITAWLLLRTPGTAIDSVEAFDRLIGSGSPVVVELYSNI
jgi:hypothetical protein